MKNQRIEIRTSPEDERLLQKAAEKLEKETGRKAMKSRAILAAVKEYAKPDPVLIYENQKTLNEIQENIEYSLVHLQKIVDEYFEIANEVPTIEELQSLFGASKRDFLVCDNEALKEQIINKLYNQLQKKHDDLVFKREHVPVPDFDRLVAACAELINAPGVNIYEVFYWQCFLIQNSKVIQLIDQVQKIKSSYRSFAETADEIKRLNDVKNLCDLLNTVFLNNVTSPLKLELPGLVNYNPILKIMVPGDVYVKYQL